MRGQLWVRGSSSPLLFKLPLSLHSCLAFHSNGVGANGEAGIPTCHLNQQLASWTGWLWIHNFSAVMWNSVTVFFSCVYLYCRNSKRVTTLNCSNRKAKVKLWGLSFKSFLIGFFTINHLSAVEKPFLFCSRKSPGQISSSVVEWQDDLARQSVQDDVLGSHICCPLPQQA